MTLFALQRFRATGDSICRPSRNAERLHSFPKLLLHTEAAAFPKGATVETKTCSACKCIKPVDEFFRRKRGSEDRQGWCKICANKGVRDSYHRLKSDPVWHSKWKARMRANFHTPHGAFKQQARSVLNARIRWGKLNRPAHCSKCGKEGKIHAHHADYSKPLEVVWLCSRCHWNLHTEMNKLP